MILAVPIGIFVMNLYQYGAFDRLIESAKELGKKFRKCGNKNLLHKTK